MWVKICGNTNLADAALAADLGANAVGFVFARSPRQVTAAQVAAITPHLPATVERIGVFDTSDPAEIATAAVTAGLTAVQLHGDFDETLLDQLAKQLPTTIEIIQALHWTIDSPGSSTSGNAKALLGQLHRIATLGTVTRVLIDSRTANASGGTGIAYDWTTARAVFLAAPPSLHIIAAGGLKPATVATAIATLAPWGVDVSTGVEASPRRKDASLVRAFIQNARTAKKP
jgi:phosphoribosylanthranilate isomerase